MVLHSNHSIFILLGHWVSPFTLFLLPFGRPRFVFPSPRPATPLAALKQLVLDEFEACAEVEVVELEFTRDPELELPTPDDYHGNNDPPANSEPSSILKTLPEEGSL